MGTASRPSTTYSRQQGLQQTLGCRENNGRSRNCWEGCMRQRACLRKRAQRGLRRRRLSGSWQRVSGMRRCEQTFWLDRRFNRCCSKPNARLPRSLKTTDKCLELRTPALVGVRGFWIDQCLRSPIPPKGDCMNTNTEATTYLPGWELRVRDWSGKIGGRRLGSEPHDCTLGVHPRPDPSGLPCGGPGEARSE